MVKMSRRKKTQRPIYQRLIDVSSWGTWYSGVRLGMMGSDGSDGSDCSVRYFDIPPISMGTFFVKYVYCSASDPGVPN